MTKRGGRYRLPLAIAVTVLACSVAASLGSASGTSSASSQAADLKKSAALYNKFVRGRLGKANPKLRPVVIGFVNNEGGIPSFPEGSVAAKAAAKFVNDKLGGVRGRPVQLKLCLVAGSEEQGQGCAQQFLNSKVKIVVEDTLVVGSQAFHQTLAGRIPVVIGDPISLADATAKNAYALSAGVFGTNPGFVGYATQYARAKTASLLFPGDDPTGQQAAKGIKDGLTQAGIDVTDVGYKSSSPDMLPSVIASGAGKTDLTVTLFPSPPTCIAGVKALQQANVTKPIVGLSTCIAEPVRQALGDYPKMTYVSVSTNPSVRGHAATDAYVRIMKAYAGGKANVGGFAQHAFIPVLAAVRALNLAGPNASAAALGSRLKAWTGPTPMFAPKVKYGSIPGLSTLPSLQTRLYTYRGNGKWADVTGGRWVGP